jgi:long-chain-fatty-acyl-CoA reductase
VELLSLTRGLLTRNLNILKTATANPVSPYYLFKSFMEVDPQHPVTRSVSVLNWERGSDIEKHLYNKVQSVCVWGGSDAVAAAWKYARPGLEILDYGPKRSMAFVSSKTLKNKNTLEEAASALAKDTTLHDQQACHSPHIVFVEGETEEFCNKLSEELTKLAVIYPRGTESIDRQTEIAHMRMMNELNGNKVYHPGNNNWTLIVTEEFSQTALSPLGRTLFIIPVKSLEDAVGFTDSYTMVAAFSDRTDLEKYRDRLAANGVDRLTGLGRMGLLPPGMPHEGRYDLTRLVKFVSTDLK